LIPVLNNNAINLASVEVNYVLRLSRRFLAGGPLNFKQFKIGENSQGDDRQDEGVPPVHTKRVVATTPWFRLERESEV